MRATVEAGHPDYTPSDRLGPVSALIAVAEEAGNAIEDARPEDLHRLMNYIRVARLMAYERTLERAHACALIDDSDLLLARKDAPASATQEAYAARGEATALCKPDAATAETEEEASPGIDKRARRQRRGFNLGFLAMGGTALFTAAAVMSVVLAVNSRNALRRRVAELEAQGVRDEWDDMLLDWAYRSASFDRGFAIGMSVASVGLWGLSAWAFVRERKRLKQQRLQVRPQGGAYGAGISLTGQF